MFIFPLQGSYQWQRGYFEGCPWNGRGYEEHSEFEKYIIGNKKICPKATKLAKC